MNERGNNHQSLWCIHDGQDDKTKDQCCETGREYKSVKCEEIELVLFLKKYNRLSGLHLKDHIILISEQNYTGRCTYKIS